MFSPAGGTVEHPLWVQSIVTIHDTLFESRVSGGVPFLTPSDFMRTSISWYKLF